MELFNSLLIMLNEMSPYILLGFLIAGLMHAFIRNRPLPGICQALTGNQW